jgi:hypothetical protein
VSPRRRRKSDEDLLVALGGLVVVGLVLVKVGQWVWAHWWVLVVLGLLALLTLAGWLYRQVDQMRSAQLRVEGLTYSLGQLDAMHHSAFEIAIRDLLARDGSRDALRCCPSSWSSYGARLTPNASAPPRSPDSDEHLLALLLTLKSYQRMGCFPKVEDIPEAVAEFVRRAVELPEGTLAV